MNKSINNIFALKFLEFLPLFLGKMVNNGVTIEKLDLIKNHLQAIEKSNFETETILALYVIIVDFTKQNKQLLLPLGIINKSIPTNSDEIEMLLKSKFNYIHLADLCENIHLCLGVMDLGVDTEGLNETFEIIDKDK
jgi:hypothetical protein